MIKSVVSVVLAIAVMFSLCACSSEKLLVLESFSSTVSFQMDDISVKGVLDYKTGEDITFTVTEPENLRDIVFTESKVKKDEVIINYSKLKDESPVYLLICIIKSMTESEIYIPLKSEYTFSGVACSAEFKTKINCETDEIISIETGNFTYNFE